MGQNAAMFRGRSGIPHCYNPLGGSFERLQSSWYGWTFRLSQM